MIWSYITVLSNWLAGYDKYNKKYTKNNIAQSTYPHEFYLLKEDELAIGLKKANNLIEKLAIQDNQIIRIETSLEEIAVHKNNRNGLGWVIPQNWIKVTHVYLYQNNQWIKSNVEELTALAYQISHQHLKNYDELIPRTLSILPVAKACQASCKFCFSESSISFEQKKNQVDLVNLNKICAVAKEKGAERFVITGGGEPTLIKFDLLLDTIRTAKQYFNKIVLISNGLFLSEKSEDEIISKVNKLIEAGLTVLSFSYHHYDKDKNAYIMGKELKTDWLLSILKKHDFNHVITLRLICVLQQEGINHQDEIAHYISYAISQGVHQICFKELYVSSTEESLYAGQKENKYSEDNQISLSILIDYLNKEAIQVGQLPWGSPVYNYKKLIDIAAYTEPSVGWEKTHGIARSWNIMADGKCFASLEDKTSLLEIK